MIELGWVRRAQRSRALHVSDDGFAGAARAEFGRRAQTRHTRLERILTSVSGQDVGLAVSVFLACAVEAVEALTIVLAVGVTRSWRSALFGVGAATVALAAIVAALGPALTALPINVLRVVVGGLLLVFGLQWLRKAVLRAAGLKAMHDEDEGVRRRDRRRAVRGARRDRLRRLLVHDRVQGRAARGARGRVHRAHVRRQPAQRRTRRRWPRPSRCAIVVLAGVVVRRAARPRTREHDEVRGRRDAHLVRDLLGRRGRRRDVAGRRRCAARARPRRAARLARARPVAARAAAAPAIGRAA